MSDAAHDSTSDDYQQAVATRWHARADPTIRSWWQSPVVMQERDRRISGDPTKSPAQYFRERFGPVELAVSLGSGLGQLEREFVELGICRRIIGLDISPERVAAATERIPDALRGRIEFRCENLEVWQPEDDVGLIVARDSLHHIEHLEALFTNLSAVLGSDGLLYVDEFVGPTRFQWTDTQLSIINRLLDRLSPELRADLDTGQPRAAVERPGLEGFIAADPSEAIRSGELLTLLDRFFEPVELRPYGGAIYHQFFNRIMGNFAPHDDLVRLIMEFDWILTETGVLSTDYVWGVYRPRE